MKKVNSDTADEELGDQKGALGHAPEDVEDIDETLESAGIASDKNGPHELNSGQVTDQADKHQE